MVGALGFVELAIVAMLVLISLMVAITVGVKALRALREAWYKSYYRLIEPALERYLLTTEPQPELERLRPWQRDRFLSTLIVERMALLRGAGREYLMKLADDLGLVALYLGSLRSRRRWKRARAAENLGFFGGPRAAGPISALLVDDDETVRAVAARALARIGSEEAVRALARTLDAPSEMTRLRVAENLERVGRPSVGPLKEALADIASLGTRNLKGPVMAAQVLGNLRAAEARGVLKQAARNGADTDVRAQATLALSKIGDPEDVPTLLACARDGAWRQGAGGQRPGHDRGGLLGAGAEGDGLGRRVVGAPQRLLRARQHGPRGRDSTPGASSQRRPLRPRPRGGHHGGPRLHPPRGAQPL